MTVEGTRHFKMSPIVRSSAGSAIQIIGQLLDYFERNAAVLDANQREMVRTVLDAVGEAQT
jgi:hypothetical protein